MPPKLYAGRWFGDVAHRRTHRGRGLVAALPPGEQQPADQRDDADLQREAEERGQAAEAAGQAAAEQQADQAGAKQAGEHAAHEARTAHQAGGRRILRDTRTARNIRARIGRLRHGALHRPRGRRGRGRRRRAVGARAAAAAADARARVGDVGCDHEERGRERTERERETETVVEHQGPPRALRACGPGRAQRVILASPYDILRGTAMVRAPVLQRG